MNLREKIKNFFSSEKIKELENRIKKQEDKDIDIPKEEEKQNSHVVEEKLIKKTIYNTQGWTLSVILTSGEVLNGMVSPDTYEKIRVCQDRDCIINLLSPPKEVEKVKYNDEEKEVEQIVSNLVDILKDNEDFTIDGNKVFFKNILSIEIPKAIVGAFIENICKQKDALGDNYYENERLKQEYSCLKYFSLKLLANPIEESREHLLSFVKNNFVQLTPSGNLCLYRRVKTKKKGNSELEAFVTQSYTKIKQQKKSPKNYWIWGCDDGTYELLNYNAKNTGIESNMGNLFDLYNNLTKVTETEYTDARTKSYKISIPGIYKIREEDIDKNYAGSCGGFLHAAALTFNYSAFGDVDCLVIINPLNAAKVDTGCPDKIGVTEMYIACTLDKDFQDIKTESIVNFDEEYEKLTITQIEEQLKNKQLSMFSVTDEVTSLNYQDLKSIADILKSRVVNI